jgi:hypothetical protein
MSDESTAGDKVSRSSPLEYTARHIDFLKTIIGGLVAVLVVAFSGGILWDQLLRYEAIVNRQKEDINRLGDDIKTFKSNLADLGTPNIASYEIEITNDSKSNVCTLGNVVTGVRRDENKLWMRCSSLGRAVWNPNTDPRQ